MVQEVAVARRTQFSSCDECRKSRVACDASARGIAGNEEDDKDDSVSCSRCLTRGRQCTFNWVRENKAAATRKNAKDKRKVRRRRGSTSASVPTEDAAERAERERLSDEGASQTFKSPQTADWASPTSAGNRDKAYGASLSLDILSEAATSPLYADLVPVTNDFLSPVESLWLSTIYRTGFDTVFGSWMGRYSNPFVNSSDEGTTDKYICISNICEQLDRWMSHENGQGADIFNGNGSNQKQSEVDLQIDRSLRSTIAAFSARWLPLVSEGTKNSTIQTLWRHARRDMLRVINRPSYRSMMSLFLFALTPIPVGITEDEEVDGISGHACVHAALQHIQSLRAQQRNLQFSGSKVSPYLKKQSIPASPESIGTSRFISAESVAYWAALTFDTSASLTLNCRSLLSSGLFGFREELSWRLVRTKAKIWSGTAQGWQPGSTDMTDDRANHIIAAGAAWKLLGWKLTAVFKEALRDGHSEDRVRDAYNAVVESIKEFNNIFRPLLETCQRRMQFLGQQTKLRWFSLMLHYHLSILMFLDIIEETDRFDLLANLKDTSSDAENVVMDTLVFGLHNMYTLSTPTLQNGGVNGSQEGNPGQKLVATLPLISIDPYPHHVVAGVQLMQKAIERDYKRKTLTEESYASLQSTLQRTLRHLPQSSKSVQAAREKLAVGSLDRAADQPPDPYRVLHAQFAE